MRAAIMYHVLVSLAKDLSNNNVVLNRPRQMILGLL